MHINWWWIRQRPHIFSELLAQNNELCLMHFSMYKTAHKSQENKPFFPLRVLWRLPDKLIKFYSFFGFLNLLFLKYQIHKQLAKFRPDIVWVTHPIFYAAIKNIAGVKVVYDCMDDHLAFSLKDQQVFSGFEKALVGMADITIFSSKTLASRVSERSNPRKSMVINNGAKLPDKLPKQFPVEKLSTRNNEIAIGYFGTISHWFDWVLILEVLHEIPTANLYVAGPLEVAIPKHPRIHYLGVLSHESLFKKAQSFDILIMPFIVNSLIEAVDPVKLYEYISFGLPCAAPAYQETSRFLPWVYLYRNSSELIEFILNFRDHGKNTLFDVKSISDSRKQFLLLNSWEARGEQLNHVLECIT